MFKQPNFSSFDENEAKAAMPVTLVMCVVMDAVTMTITVNFGQLAHASHDISQQTVALQ